MQGYLRLVHLTLDTTKCIFVKKKLLPSDIHTKRSQILVYFPSSWSCLEGSLTGRLTIEVMQGFSFMPAYTPVTSMPWKKTFTALLCLLPQGAALETGDGSGFALTLPFTSMVYDSRCISELFQHRTHMHIKALTHSYLCAGVEVNCPYYFRINVYFESGFQK